MKNQKSLSCLAAFECGADGNWRASALVFAVLAASAGMALWLNFGRYTLGSVSG